MKLTNVKILDSRNCNAIPTIITIDSAEVIFKYKAFCAYNNRNIICAKINNNFAILVSASLENGYDYVLCKSYKSIKLVKRWIIKHYSNMKGVN